MSELKRIIELLEEQGKKISKMEKILDTLSQDSVKLEKSAAKGKPKSENERKYHGLSAAIHGLIKESFFDTPKEIGEINKKLKADAVFYPITSYPDSLLRLIKHKELRRIKENNKWRYVKYG